MGYTTTFEGRIEVSPPLNKQEIEYLTKFNNTRRMNRRKGGYYVDAGGWAGQDREIDIVDYNSPPEGQPGLWCQWTPTPDGKYIEWDQGEKFYDSVKWMQYLIDHFIGSNPIAKTVFPFMEGHKLIGKIKAKGEEAGDRWTLLVINDFAIALYKSFKSKLNETEAAILAGLTGRYMTINPKNLENMDLIENKIIANLVYNWTDKPEVKTYLAMKDNNQIFKKRYTGQVDWMKAGALNDDEGFSAE